MPLNMVAKLAITAAMSAAQMALTMTQRIKGPRLESTDVTLADYGTPIPRFWGKRRFEGCPIIWAERLKEVKHESKGKGGKYDEYRYYGTFAVLIADHEIEAVSRIWLDKHLCYNATTTGPLSVFFGLVEQPDGTRTQAPVKLQRGRNMRVYLGTETQEADARMESWCEDRYGADSCPAYRGVSYIVFQDIPLEKFGNRLPQVSVEAVNVTTSNYPCEVFDETLHLTHVKFAPDYSRFVLETGSTLTIWDVPSRTKMITATIDASNPSITTDGGIWMTGDLLGSTLFRYSSDGQSVVASYSLPSGLFSDFVFTFGTEVYLRQLGGANRFLYFNGAEVLAITIGFAPQFYFQEEGGTVWAMAGASGSVYFYSRTKGSFTVSSPGTGSAYALDNGDGSFFVRHGSYCLLIDKDTHALTSSASVAINLSSDFDYYRNAQVGASSIWVQNTITTVREYSTTTLAALRTLTLSNWRAADVDNMVYDPVNHALITSPALPDEIDWRYLDRIGSDGVTLESVVTDVAGWCGLDSIDASDLSQTVEGYSVTQGSGKDMIAPLLDLHDSLVRPHDFSVQFLQRGDSSLGTLATEDFVRSGDEARYSLSIVQDTDLPRRITVNFADIGKEQQTNTVISQRPLDSVDGNREQTIDMTTYVMAPADAQKFADRYFRREWNSRESAKLKLTAQNLALEPGDVYTLELDGVTRTACLEKLTLSQGALNTEWTRDFAGLHTLGTGAGADMEGRDDDVIFVPAPAKGFILDGPLIIDADNDTNPLLYYAAGPYASQWAGASVLRGDDDTYDEVFGSVESGMRATWGYATDALANANFRVWDRGNTVNIEIFSGTPTSATEAELDADPTLNLAMLGDEYLQYSTVTLESDGTYTLSGFKRGRRGTEWACSTHAAGDEFALLSTFEPVEMGASDIGTAMKFKAVSFGRTQDSAPEIDVTYAGNTLKPYAPARLKVYYDGTDLACTIIRRTRVGGTWTGGTTIPLSETTQEYEVDVYNGATLKRTITVTGTNTFTYTAAFAAADGITLPAQPTFKVYQMSDVVGRGYELAA